MRVATMISLGASALLGVGALFVARAYLPSGGDKSAEAWRPHAEAALDFGALSWGLFRSTEGGSDFLQHALFPTKADFERYWYSEQIAEARISISGLFNVPLLPTYNLVVGMGSAVTTEQAV